MALDGPCCITCSMQPGTLTIARPHLVGKITASQERLFPSCIGLTLVLPRCSMVATVPQLPHLVCSAEAHSDTPAWQRVTKTDRQAGGLLAGHLCPPSH